MQRSHRGDTGGRHQQARSLKTQEQILDAAVDVLSTEGYGKATTLRIQEAAEVSRGRLLHHYPSRDELLAAAVHHLAAARMDALTVRTRWPEDRASRIDLAIEVMWSTHQQSYFWASTELWVAARHNERLQSLLAPQERTLGRYIRSIVDGFFGAEITAMPNYPMLIEILLASMRGTALTYALTRGEPRTEPQLENWKRTAAILLAPEAPASTPS